MIPNELDVRILDDIEPIVKGMGFDIVELRSVRTKSGTQVFAVIYRPEGVDLEICADILKTIRPRIQMVVENPDVRIEVSSPGLERVLKDRREYRIFLGRGMRILVKGKDDWLDGIVTDAAEKGITLDTGKEKLFLAFEDIRKAKLDYRQEVE